MDSAATSSGRRQDCTVQEQELHGGLGAACHLKWVNPFVGLESGEVACCALLVAQLLVCFGLQDIDESQGIVSRSDWGEMSDKQWASVVRKLDRGLDDLIGTIEADDISVSDSNGESGDDDNDSRA